MATLARLYDFTPGTVIRSSEVDNEFNQLVNILNGTSTNKQAYIQLSDTSLATLKVNQVVANANASVISLLAGGVEKVKVDGTGRIVSLVARTGSDPESTGDTPAANVPFVVASTARVVNLNADMVDGFHADDLQTIVDGEFLADLTISNAGPCLIFDDTDTDDTGDCALCLDDNTLDPGEQVLALSRLSDGLLIQRWNIAQGTSQFHNVVSLRADNGDDIDITVSVGGSDPDQHLTPKAYVDDAITAALAGIGSGDDAIYDPGKHMLREMYAASNGSSTAMVRPTLCTGGLSVVGTASNGNDSDGPWVVQTSSAGSGARASFTSTNEEVQTRFGNNTAGEVVFKIKTGSSIANVRIFVGLSTGDITSVDTSTPQDHCALFRYDTGADGTAFWRVYTNDNDGSSTVTTTSQSIAANTVYRLKIRFTATAIRFYINETFLAEHTTNLPSSSTVLGLFAGLRTLEAVAKAIKLSYAGMWF